MVSTGQRPSFNPAVAVLSGGDTPTGSIRRLRRQESRGTAEPDWLVDDGGQPLARAGGTIEGFNRSVVKAGFQMSVLSAREAVMLRLDRSGHRGHQLG
jgi:hypothetical protein